MTQTFGESDSKVLGFEQWLTGYVIENEQDGKNDRISIEVKVLNEGFTSLGA